MKRYHFEFKKVVGRAFAVVLLASPNGYAQDVQQIKLSDSIREVQVNLAAQESHPVYETVAYQGTCTKTEYREEYQCRTDYETQCGNVYECHERPVQICDRGASLFDFSILSVANAAESGRPPPGGGGGGDRPERPDRPDHDRPERPERPERPDPRPEPRPDPIPERPSPPMIPDRPERPDPRPEPRPDPRPDRPDRPDHPRPDPRPDRPDRPDHPRPDPRPVCRTEYRRECGYEHRCNSVPVQKCGYEQVPYEVSYSCTKYKEVLSHHELDFNVQALAKVNMVAAERLGNEELFNVILDGAQVKLTQDRVSTQNLVLVTTKSNQSQIVKPDQGPKSPGLKRIAAEIEVGLIPLATLNAELQQKLVETKIQGNVLSFVLTNSTYAEQLGVKLKLVEDKLIDKTLINAVAPASAVTVERFGQSARISVDLLKLTSKAPVKKGKKYKVALELSTVLPSDAKVLNPQLVPKAAKGEVKLKAE